MGDEVGQKKKRRGKGSWENGGEGRAEQEEKGGSRWEQGDGAEGMTVQDRSEKRGQDR